MTHPNVEEHGQDIRNMVEEALKSRRQAEEAILKALVEDGEREQRLEDKQRKKAEWTKRFWQLESSRMITKMEGMTISEEREVMEMMEMGDVLKDMDGNIHMEDVPDRRKKSSFARKNSIKFKGSLMLVTRKVETLGNIVEEMDMLEGESEEQAEHTDHGAQDRASSRMESGGSQEEDHIGYIGCWSDWHLPENPSGVYCARYKILSRS